MVQKHLNKLIIRLHQKIGQAVSEKKTFKDYVILYMCIAQVQGQITLGNKILIVTKRVCYIDQTIYVSAFNL